MLQQPGSVLFPLPGDVCVPAFALIKDRFRNWEPSINSHREKILSLPGRKDGFRQMRATKCHGDGGLKRLGVSCVRGERHPEGHLSDEWRLPPFRLMPRKMEEGETCRGSERARTLSVIYNGSKPVKNKSRRGYSDATTRKRRQQRQTKTDAGRLFSYFGV